MPPCGALYGIWVLGDCGKTEIRNSRAVRSIHKDIRLDTCKNSGRTGFIPITHSLETTMNDVTRVDIVKAASDIAYLAVGVSIDQAQQDGHPQDYANPRLGFLANREDRD